MLGTEQDSRCPLRIERELRQIAPPVGDPARLIERAQGLQRLPCRRDRGSRRWIEPGEFTRIVAAPLGQPQHERREIGSKHLGRIVRRAAAVACLFPQPIGNARSLTGGTARTLGGGRLARPMGHQMRRSRRSVEFGPPRKARVDHDRNAVERQRRLGDSRSQHDPAPTIRIATNGGALSGRIDLTMQRQDQRGGDPIDQPLMHPLDFTHAGQEGKNVPLLLAPGGRNRLSHGIFDRQLR